MTVLTSDIYRRRLHLTIVETIYLNRTLLPWPRFKTSETSGGNFRNGEIWSEVFYWVHPPHLVLRDA